jgi:hypothetical protein
MYRADTGTVLRNNGASGNTVLTENTVLRNIPKRAEETRCR